MLFYSLVINGLISLAFCSTNQYQPQISFQSRNIQQETSSVFKETTPYLENGESQNVIQEDNEGDSISLDEEELPSKGSRIHFDFQNFHYQEKKNRIKRAVPKTPPKVKVSSTGASKGASTGDFSKVPKSRFEPRPVIHSNIPSSKSNSYPQVQSFPMNNRLSLKSLQETFESYNIAPKIGGPSEKAKNSESGRKNGKIDTISGDGKVKGSAEVTANKDAKSRFFKALETVKDGVEPFAEILTDNRDGSKHEDISSTPRILTSKRPRSRNSSSSTKPSPSQQSPSTPRLTFSPNIKIFKFVAENEEFDITCIGTVKLVEWLHNNVKISENKNNNVHQRKKETTSEGENKRTLKFKKVQKENEGEYTCSGILPSNSTITRNFDLYVKKADTNNWVTPEETYVKMERLVQSSPEEQSTTAFGTRLTASFAVLLAISLINGFCN